MRPLLLEENADDLTDVLTGGKPPKEARVSTELGKAARLSQLPVHQSGAAGIGWGTHWPAFQAVLAALNSARSEVRW